MERGIWEPNKKNLEKKTNVDRRPMSSTLRKRKRKNSNDRRKFNLTGNYTMAKTRGRNHETDSIRESIFE